MDRYTIVLKKDDDSKIIVNGQSKGIDMLVSEQIVLTRVKTQSKSVSPTESAQTVTPDQGYDALSSVAVDAISSSYVGSGIQRRSSSDLTVSGASITAPVGYYSSAATKSVTTATQATPQLSLNSSTGLVTASATQSTGYVSGGTTSSELQLSTQAAKSITPSTSSQTAVSAGKYTTGAVTVSAMPSGTAGTPTATKGTVSNHSVSVTPSVTNTTGYITGGTNTGTAVTVNASELVSGTYSVTSSGTKDVTNYASASIPSGTEGTPSATKGTVNNHSVSVTPSVTNGLGFISGGTHTGTAVTVSASELVSGSQNITTNNTYDVTNLASVVVNVSGGSSMNAQSAQSTTRATSSTYTKCVSLTCSKAGTYDVYWSTFRSSTSGTSGSQLYVDGSAYGTADTTTWSNHIQNMHLTGVSIGASEEVAVYARSRGSNYYSYVGTLTIIQTS